RFVPFSRTQADAEGRMHLPCQSVRHRHAIVSAGRAREHHDQNREVPLLSHRSVSRESPLAPACPDVVCPRATRASPCKGCVPQSSSSGAYLPFSSIAVPQILCEAWCSERPKLSAVPRPRSRLRVASRLSISFSVLR